MAIDFKSWMDRNKAKLCISEEYFHHHAFEILNSNKVFHEKFTNDLSKDISITPRIKITKNVESPAIKAEDLNREIREVLKSAPSENLRFEVVEDRGVFYFSSEKSSIGGFDFAYINHEKNIIALRNLCFGEIQYHDGLKRWNSFINKNKELRHILQKIDAMKIGHDIAYEKRTNDPPLFVGEIQFGNWALAYRDFFKVLKANVQNSIDCLIYIVPTGNLESMLSDGIVTFEKTKKILDEFAKVISVPVWLVGIDLKLDN